MYNIKVKQAGMGNFLTPFQRQLLQKKIQEDCSESYRQRIEIMLLADQGRTQTEICQILGCSAATARHWIHIASSGMAHQWQDCPIGRPKTVNEEYLERLKELLSSSPRDHGYSFRRWTVNWLQKHLAREFGVEVSDLHINRLLKHMGLSTRCKTNNYQSTITGNAGSSKIVIYDLKSDNIPENNGFLPIELPKLDTKSKTYGAKSTRFIGFSGTVEPSVRSFFVRNRISNLLPAI